MYTDKYVGKYDMKWVFTGAYSEACFMRSAKVPREVESNCSKTALRIKYTNVSILVLILASYILIAIYINRKANYTTGILLG